LVSLTEAIDTTTPAGRMMLTMLAGFAQFERELISERTKTAMAQKRAQGQRIGQVPFGLRVGADGVTLERDTAEAEAIGLVVELRARGLSLRKIASELNTRAIATKERNGRWHEKQIRRLLSRSAA
jgi:site-specific DNA recombinase